MPAKKPATPETPVAVPPRPAPRAPTAKDFLKRRSEQEGLALADAAHLATYRLYCDALGYWRRCNKPRCKRQRCCLGDAAGCLLRGLMHTPQAERLVAEREVIAGGPRRIPPATHMEWLVRRSTLQKLVSWRLA